jgi:predicted TPR repeat methyltransferase
MSTTNEQSYDKIANFFNSSRRDAKVPELVEEFSQYLKEGDRVLDVGCGGGAPITNYLYEKELQITGIDLSAKLLQLAKRHVPNGEFIKGDIMDFQTDRVFSGIVAWDSLFHLQIHEHEAVFRKLFDLLKQGGYLLFTHGGSEGEIMGEMYAQPFTYSSLGPDKTRKIVEQLGLDILRWEIDYSEPHGYMKALCKKR